MPQPASSSKSKKSLVNQTDAASATDGLPCVFERHLLLKRIAKGGMGEVFLASAAGAIDGAERPCVVKVIREEHIEDSSFVARFLDEARIQSQLEHPGVVRVINASHDEKGKPYVVLEHVEGRNLSEVRLRVQQLGIRLTWPDAVAMALGLCEAVAHIHERTDAAGRPLEIVHRDLSPQNVMVAYGGDVKLIDFGTARGQNRKCHTVSGIVFAKPGYVAPEVANNRPGGVPADLYAVGIMLWELLSGRRFITGEAADHLALVAAGEKVVSPISEAVNAPPELDLICQRLTATLIEDRYESAREAASELASLLKRAPSTSDGQRSVRVRVSQLMARLYPAEPTRTRAEFQRLIASARSIEPPASAMIPAPSPPPPATADDGAALLAGTRYELGEPIGAGASGTVYDATHVDLGRRAALKLFHSTGKVTAEALETFRREARLAAQLNHDNIVRVQDFGTTKDGRVFLAMERLEGKSLDEHLSATGPLEHRSALLLGVQICRALEAAHEQGIAHGDLKPQNLFLTRQGTVKLLDFGVSALYRHDTATVDDASKEGEEGAFTLSGTPDYLSPEQLRGQGPAATTDQYALGIVLYEMMTGSRPHEADSLGVLLAAKLSGTVEAPSLRAPGPRLPKSVDKICLRLLASDAEERYSSVAAAREAMEAALAATAMGHKKPARAMRIATVSTLLALSALVVAQRSPVVQKELHQVTAQVASFAQSHLTVSAMPLLKRAGAAVQQSMAQAVARLEQGKPASNEAALAKATFEVSPSPVESPAANVEAAAESIVSTDASLTAIERALKNGKPVVALTRAREAAEQGSASPALYRLWIEAAVQTRAFGEAHRISKRLATLEPTTENELSLAQLERRLGRNEAARRTLDRLLTKEPNNAEALALRGRIDGNARVAAR